MKPILVLYASTEGQTRKIAAFIASMLRERGHTVDEVDAATPEAAAVNPMYAAAIVAGSLHEGRYQARLRQCVRDNAAWLNAIPCAFVSVSLTAVIDADPASRQALERIADRFCAHTGWRPGITEHVAGALRYSEYGPLKRRLMRWIAARQGGATDMRRDVEYTDWPRLRRFVEAFLQATRLQMHPRSLPAAA